jgi:hypothetical protein
MYFLCRLIPPRPSFAIEAYEMPRLVYASR